MDTHTLTCKLSSFTHPAHVAESLPELTERQNAQARTKPGQNKVGQKRAPHAAHVAPAPRTPPRAARRPPPAARRPRSVARAATPEARAGNQPIIAQAWRELRRAQASSGELKRAQASSGRGGALGDAAEPRAGRAGEQVGELPHLAGGRRGVLHLEGDRYFLRREEAGADLDLG